MADPAPLVLDGSYGEGGGQILRTALFLSVLTGRPFRMDRIRQGRREPGLKPQHAGIVELLCRMTDSRAENVRPGAASISFQPGRLAPGSHRFDIGTAGSIPLFLQTLIPTMLATPGATEVELVGGTDVLFGPTIDWVRRVAVPLLAPLADSLRVEVERRGFYPKGGGRVKVRAVGSAGVPGREALERRVRQSLGRERLAWTEPSRIEVVSVEHASLASARVAARQAEACVQALRGSGLSAAVETATVDALSPGSSVTVVAIDSTGNRIGADGLGARAVTAETVGRETAARFLRDFGIGAACDEHFADHWVPWAALGGGALRVPRSTPHLETNLWVCRQFLGERCVRLEDGILRGA